jgi:hypothetical protein
MPTSTQFRYLQSGVLTLGSWTSYGDSEADTGQLALLVKNTSASRCAAFRFTVPRQDVKWDSITWNFTATNATETANMDIYIDTRLPPAYSTTNKPLSRSGLTLLYSASTAISTTVATNIVISLNDSTTGAANTLNSQVDSGYYYHIGSDVGTAPWIGMVVVWSGEDAFIGQQLLTTYSPMFTGLEGAKYARAHGRADECPKCGGKSTRDTWVMDGYTEILVCPKCYDEPDLTGRVDKVGRERPPIND